MRWLKLLFVLALNAIPFYGALYRGWSVSTILALFWVENIMIIAATSARIVAHRVQTRRCGHWGGAQPTVEDGVIWIPPNGNAFLREFLGMSVIFTLAHGIFVLAIVFGMSQKHPDDSLWQFSFDQFRLGLVSMAAVIVTDFLTDLPVLRRRSFAWLKTHVDRRSARVMILHIAIIFGMLALLTTDSPLGLLGVLIGLKTLVDLSAAWFGEREHMDDLPAEPPAWALKMVNAMSDERKREQFLRKWREDFARQQESSRRNEVVMPGP
jgi:hypothetical protein